MPKKSIHEQIAEEVNLAKLYALDGAFLSASLKYEQASKMCEKHHYEHYQGKGDS